jgi:pimeloyl-ACP methyl ester carboxylesterase
MTPAMLTKVRLSQGRKLIAGVCLSPGSRDWVVYLPESGSGFQYGTRRELERHLPPKVAAAYNYLVINKTGLAPDRKDRAAFESSFRRNLRVQDARAALKQVVPANGKIFLIGYSEGAYLAPEIARGDRRIQAVALIGGGTRGWLKEELSQVRGREREEVARSIRRIYREPRSVEKWHDFSYATWYSYREDRTLRALKGLNLPVLALLGARDRVIDLKATLKDLKGLRRTKPVDVQVLKNCGHEFHGRWNSVRRSLSEFLDTST